MVKRNKKKAKVVVQISNQINNNSQSDSRLIKRPKKIPIKKGQWSYEEDKLLEQWVKQYGAKDWEVCGHFIQGRRGKQCREHWKNCLDPDLVKGDWTKEEDFLIMFFYEKCNGSWKKIIQLFNGRTESSIKNRFYSKLRKYVRKKMNSKEKSAFYAKVKLHKLKKYLNAALAEAKADFLKKSKMTEEEFNVFIKNKEQKLNENLLDLSQFFDTNYANLFSEEETEDIFSEKKCNFPEDKICIEISSENKSSILINDNKDNNNKCNNDYNYDYNNIDESSMNNLELPNNNIFEKICEKDFIFCNKNNKYFNNNYIEDIIIKPDFNAIFELAFKNCFMD